MFRIGVECWMMNMSLHSHLMESSGKLWSTITKHPNSRRVFPIFTPFFLWIQEVNFAMMLKRRSLLVVNLENTEKNWGMRRSLWIANALTAKFENPEFKKVLVATKKAKLLHFVRGSEPEVDMLLMELRKP